MTFFKRQDIGRIYVIRMTLPGDQIIYKIGMTKSNRSLDRMMELLRSWFSKYRFVPHSRLILDMETGCPIPLEKHIHKILAVHQYIPNHDVDGKTEYFIDINEFRVLHYLKSFNEDLLRNPLNLSEQDYSNLCQLISP